MPKLVFCAIMLNRISVDKYAQSISFQTQYALLHKIDILCIKKEDSPFDSRCGSVETCRNAVGILLSVSKNACEMVGAFRVEKTWQV